MPDERLEQAVKRLRDFRATWEDGDLICESSRLTVEDLDVVLAALGDVPAVAADEGGT